MNRSEDSPFVTSIAPWLSVRGAATAIQFYKSAFGAKEVYHIEDPEGAIVSRLSVAGAEFWVSDDKDAVASTSVRLILTVEDPDAVFEQALCADAVEISPMANAYGWRVGRIADPFGFHWEIGHPDKATLASD